MRTTLKGQEEARERSWDVTPHLHRDQLDRAKLAHNTGPCCQGWSRGAGKDPSSSETPSRAPAAAAQGALLARSGGLKVKTRDSEHLQDSSVLPGPAGTSGIGDSGHEESRGAADSCRLTDSSPLRRGGALPLFTGCLLLPGAKSLQSHQAPKPERGAQALPHTNRRREVCRAPRERHERQHQPFSERH